MLPCDCKLTSEPGAFPATYDQSACRTHGPDAPRYFVDHGEIHDRITGQHVSIQDAAGMLSVEPEAVQRIAWGVVAELGAKLKNAAADNALLSANLTACREDLARYRALVEQLNRELELEARCVEARDRSIAELKSKLAEVETERDEARACAALEAQHHAFLRKERDEARAKLAEVERDLRNANEHAASMVVAYNRELSRAQVAEYDRDSALSELAQVKARLGAVEPVYEAAVAFHDAAEEKPTSDGDYLTDAQAAQDDLFAAIDHALSTSQPAKETK